MPTGTGKTITLLSLITSYQLAHPDVGKLVYCTRTVPEMEKVLAELRELVRYRGRYFEGATGAAAGITNGGGAAGAGAGAGGAEGRANATGAADMEEGGAGGAAVPSAAALAAQASARAHRAAASAASPNSNQQPPQSAPPPILALGLSSRKNLCVHPTVAEEGSRESVDAGCRRLTASWVRAKAQEAAASGGAASPPATCSFYEAHDAAGPDALLPPGVYTLHDLRAEGRRRGWCPYFLARRLVAAANVVVYSYQYLVDPKVAQAVSRELERECVVVFDEAHNIDNVCIEALSVSLREHTLRAALRGCGRLDGQVAAARRAGRERLDAEYRRLVQGLVDAGQLPTGAAGGDGGENGGGNGNGGGNRGGGEDWLASPVLPEDVARDAVPGNLRRAEHFVAFMRRLVAHLQSRLRPREVTVEGPARFLAGVARATLVEPNSLRHCHDRLSSLLSTLEVTDTDEYLPLQLVADFATLLGTYPTGGFAVVMEPHDERLPHVPDPVLQLSCLDASLAMRPVFSRFRSVVVTSGTLSPIDLYPRILDFRPVVCQSLGMTMTRAAACPVVVGRASDSVPLSSRFEGRYDESVVRGYGRLLVELAGVVPDGMVRFLFLFDGLFRPFSFSLSPALARARSPRNNPPQKTNPNNPNKKNKTGRLLRLLLLHGPRRRPMARVGRPARPHGAQARLCRNTRRAGDHVGAGRLQEGVRLGERRLLFFHRPRQSRRGHRL
jgi:DNA excision repair protein ERCC-2